jgi:DNA-binding transcriptional LysR family regulator
MLRPTHMLDLDDAGAFVDVAEAKSLSRAARLRGVAPTTLGRTMDRLEARFGVQLVHRTPRALALTPAGERFLEEARALVERARLVDRAMGQLGRAPSGLVRASLCSGYARHRLLPALASFAKAHPDVHLELAFGDEPPDLSAGGVDLAVRIVPLTRGSAVVTKLERYAHVLVAAPSYLARHGSPATPGALESHVCIGMRTDRSWTAWPFRDARGTEVVGVRPRVEVSDVDALLAMVTGGVGVTVLPSYVAAPEIIAGRLEVLLDTHTLPPGQAFAVHAARRQLTSATRALLDALRSAARA